MPINAAYATALPESTTSKFPSLQATEYKPRSLKEDISLAIPEKALEFLSDADKAILLAGAKVSKSFVTDDGKEEEVTLYTLDHIRWIPLGIPEIQFYNKKQNKYFPRQKGVDHMALGCVTASRLLMCALKPDNTLIMSQDNTPQPFLLKLTSTKCGIINGAKKDPDLKSLRSLNAGLAKHFKLDPKSLWLCLCSVPLKPIAKYFQGKEEGSNGVMFTFDGGARELPDELQSQMFKLIQTQEVRDVLADPFNVIPKIESDANPESNYDDDF